MIMLYANKAHTYDIIRHVRKLRDAPYADEDTVWVRNVLYREKFKISLTNSDTLFTFSLNSILRTFEKS